MPRLQPLPSVLRTSSFCLRPSRPRTVRWDPTLPHRSPLQLPVPKLRDPSLPKQSRPLISCTSELSSASHLHFFYNLTTFFRLLHEHQLRLASVKDPRPHHLDEAAEQVVPENPLEASMPRLQPLPSVLRTSSFCLRPSRPRTVRWDPTLPHRSPLQLPVPKLRDPSLPKQSRPLISCTSELSSASHLHFFYNLTTFFRLLHEHQLHFRAKLRICPSSQILPPFFRLLHEHQLHFRAKLRICSSSLILPTFLRLLHEQQLHF